MVSFAVRLEFVGLFLVIEFVIFVAVFVGLCRPELLLLGRREFLAIDLVLIVLHALLFAAVRPGPVPFIGRWRRP